MKRLAHTRSGRSLWSEDFEHDRLYGTEVRLE